MKIEEINQILDTYELSESKKLHIKKQLRNYKYKSYSFNQIYTNIGHLVEKLEIPYIEKNSQSLNQEISTNTTTNLSYFLGKEDLIEFERDETYSQEQISNELEKNINQELEPHTLNLLEKLLQQSQLEFEDIKGLLKKLSSTKATEIYQRLEIFQKRFYENNEDSVYNDKTTITSFSPLTIKVKGRKFNKNPINYYMENINLYKGLTRTQLATLDEGLFRALHKYKQIDDAMPKIKKAGELSKDKINVIISTFKKTRSITKTIELTRHSPNTVIKYCKLNKLETNPYILTAETKKK
jgi:hypothetical protein